MADPPRDRLRNLEGLLRSGKGGLVRGRDLSSLKRARVDEQEAWARSLGGRALARAEGTCLFFEHCLPWDELWGRAPLARVRQTALHTLPHLARGAPPAPAGLEEIAFVDIESTGLFGGTGTCAFLVAVGAVRPEGFRVRQFFMRDFGEEAAQLAALEEELGGFRCLASYNGRAFDIPFLSSRFIIQRRRLQAAEWPHFDALFPARRIWRARLCDCSLQNLELELFGLERDDDIPGELIPRAYFNFLRGRQLDDMARVIRHNVRDVVSTALILAQVSRVLRQEEELDHAADQAALARWLEALGDLDRARAAYRRLLGSAHLSAPLRWECSRALSLLHKRAGQWDEAMALWEAMARGARRMDPFPFEEQAKHYEHRLRDCARALAVVEGFLETFELAEGLGRAPRLDLEGLLHRRARLLRKLAGNAAPEDDGLRE